MKNLKAQRWCVRATACPPCSYCCLKVGVLLRAETMAMLCNYVICQAAQFVGKLLKVPSMRLSLLAHLWQHAVLGAHVAQGGIDDQSAWVDSHIEAHILNGSQQERRRSG